MITPSNTPALTVGIKNWLKGKLKVPCLSLSLDPTIYSKRKEIKIKLKIVCTKILNI